MKWFKKISIFLFYVYPFFLPSHAADKDDNHVRNISPSKKSQMKENRSSYIKKNDILDLHHLSQLNAYKEVVRYITDGYNQSRIMCHVMTGRGNHTNSNGTKGVLRAKFPEWTQTQDLAHLIKSYRFDETHGTYIVMLNRKDNYKYKAALLLSTNSTAQKKAVENQNNFPKLPPRNHKKLSVRAG